MSDKLPAFQFYVGDWQKDPGLRRSSKAAKGVWMDILCLMHECEERGVLISAGKPWPDEDIAVAVGGDVAENLRCLQELLEKGVARRRADDAVYSARMVSDEARRRQAKENGKGGGNPDLVKRVVKGGDNQKPTPGVKQKQGSSVSASSSASPAKSEETAKDPAAGAAPAKDAPDPRVTSLTKYFYDALKELLKEKPTGFNGGQAGDLWKKLLKDFTEAEIKTRIDAWLASTRPFVVENIQSIGLFRSNFAGLKNGPIKKQEFGGTQNGKQPVAGYAAPGRARLADPE